MSYKLTIYSMIDYDHSGLGKSIWGDRVLREDIPKITTARILACRYSKQYEHRGVGQDISVWEGNKRIEKIWWGNDKCRMEKTSVITPTPKGFSPIMHHYYDVNARDGTVKLQKNDLRKW